MPIDWFTVGAQTLNFLILVWLLKRFLYQPILDAIDAREKRIAQALADAEAQKAQARQQSDSFQQKSLAFDQERAALLQQATLDASAERQRLLADARLAADALRTQRQDALQREQQSLQADIQRRTRDEVFAIARKTLADLAGTTLEARMAEVFVQRLHGLAGAEKQALATALHSGPGPVRVRSAFALPPAQQSAIQQALQAAFASDAVLRFELAPEVVSGIELSVQGQKLAWSIADYLGGLEKSIDALLAAQATPAAAEKAA